MKKQNNLKIQNLAEEDRPREKLLLKGRASLSDAELIAILIGSGSREQSAVELSKTILQSTNNNLHELAKLNVKELQKFKGIGEAKAISIVSALELGRRRKASEVIKKPKITSSEEAYQVIKPHLLDLPHEEFWMILLNRANEVIRLLQISSGGIAGTVADSRIIFKAAFEHLASAIIVVHNHPSESLTPSQADINITNKLKEAGDILETPLLDHLIFTNHRYFSFADNGLL